MKSRSGHDSDTSARLDEVRAERELFAARIRETVSEIRELLHEDLEQFVIRSVRAAFLEDPEGATALSDDALRELKVATTRRAAEIRDRLLASLEDDALWLEPGPLAEAPRGLQGNPRVWSLVSSVSEEVGALVKEIGLRLGELPPYEEPRRFIRSRLLTNLTERYWAALADLRGADEGIAQILREEARDELARRWDEA